MTTIPSTPLVGAEGALCNTAGPGGSTTTVKRGAIEQGSAERIPAAPRGPGDPARPDQGDRGAADRDDAYESWRLLQDGINDRGNGMHTFIGVPRPEVLENLATRPPAIEQVEPDHKPVKPITGVETLEAAADAAQAGYGELEQQLVAIKSSVEEGDMVGAQARFDEARSMLHELLEAASKFDTTVTGGKVNGPENVAKRKLAYHVLYAEKLGRIIEAAMPGDERL